MTENIVGAVKALTGGIEEMTETLLPLAGGGANLHDAEEVQEIALNAIAKGQAAVKAAMGAMAGRGSP